MLRKTWGTPKLSPLDDFEVLQKQEVKAEAELLASWLSAEGML